MMATPPDEIQRINQFIARCGAASRREADAAIRAGRVKLNGRKVTEPGLKVHPGEDRVQFDGRLLERPAQTVCLLLNKPRGVLTTTRDPHGRPTVLSLVDCGRRVVPVGRLDRDSNGLLLLTDDGDLSQAMQRPDSHVPKEYLVLTEAELSPEQLQRFAEGLPLDGRPTRPCLIERVGHPKARPRYRIELIEGRNRQIRRMMELLGHRVERLTRRRIGPLSIDGLQPAQWRFLSRKEIDALWKAVRRSQETG
jgi:pseudouridine synthase